MMTTDGYSDVIRILPRVYQLLLDHEQDIQDDTWLEKLLTWFQQSFSNDEELSKDLLDSTGVFSFLQSASKAAGGFCLCFALRVLPCIASYISSRIQRLSSHRPIVLEGSLNPEKEADRKLTGSSTMTLEGFLHTGQAILKRGCMTSSDMSVTYAWVLAIGELVNMSRRWLQLLDDVDAVTVAIALLDHESLFVIQAAETFLAKVLLLEVTAESVELGPDKEAATVRELDDEGTEGLDAIIRRWHVQMTEILTDTRHLGVLIELLNQSPDRGLRLMMRMDMTDTHCASLSNPAAGTSAANLIVLQLQIIANMSVIQAKAHHQFVTSVIKAVAVLIENDAHWKIVCQLLPPLLAHKRNHNEGLEQSISKIVLMMLSTLSSTYACGASKHLQPSDRLNTLLCMDTIIKQGLGSLEGFTAEVMVALQSHFDWITAHCVGSGRSLMAKNIKQTFDVVTNLISVHSGDNHDIEDWLSSIVHRVLDIISTADCDNTILNKGLGILKAFLQSFEADEGLLLALKDVLNKHLVSTYWGIRDSSLQFIGSLIDNPDVHVTDWIIKAELHLALWRSLDDEEDYVRQAALNSLGNLTRHQVIFTDFMVQTDLKKVDITEKVTSIICHDSGGFARRAAMRLLCDWFRDDISLLLSPTQSSNDLQPSNIAEMVISSVTAATREFDWEVKLLASQFWEQFLGAVVPGLIPSDGDANKITNKPVALSVNSKDGDCKNEQGVKMKRYITDEPLSVTEGEAPAFPNKSPRLENNCSDTVDSAEIPAYAADLTGATPTYVQQLNTSDTVPSPSVTGSGDHLLPNDSLKPSENSSDTSVPGKIPVYAADRKSGDSTIGKNELCDQGYTHPAGISIDVRWVTLLKDHVCLGLLVEKLNDEDTAVCRKSCDILVILRDHLKELVSQSASSHGEDGSQPVTAEVQAIIDTIQASDMDTVHTTLTECSHKNMAALLEDIVMVAEREKKIDIDCY